MRFYKLAGSEQYVSWDTLHNVAGYSEQATNEITWKSVANWGTSAGTGYELTVELFGDSELFMDDVFGWHDLDCFALEVGVYPSTASDMVLTHPTYGSSPVVFMVFDDGTYYLIQKDISQGWMTEEEYTERGWQLPGYIVLNSETGAILGAAKGHELETVPIPACVIASPGMECVPIPARVLESPEMVVYVPEPEPEPEYLDIFFYFSQNSYGTGYNGVTFEANDYWASLVIDSTDKNTLTSFGVSLDDVDTPYRRKYVVSRASLNDFAFTPIGLYSGVRTGERDVDMSNFYCDIYASATTGSPYSGVCIWSRNAYNLVCKTWKCRITRINGGN